EMRPKAGGKFMEDYTEQPTWANKEKTVRSFHRNDDYKEYSVNYNYKTGDYNNGTSLTEKEQAIRDLFQSTINAYATTHSMRKFAEQGYMPRRSITKVDSKYLTSQALGALGLEFRNTGETQWSDKIDYANDFDADFDMMQ